jgi:hypothetical protein
MTNKSVSALLAIGLLLVAIGRWQASFAAPAASPSHPLAKQASDFVETTKLVANDGQMYSGFGSSVAIDGDTMVVGAPHEPTIESVGGFLAPGEAYVFVRDGGSWTFQAKLAASDGTIDDRFGYSVTVEGDTILVGAYMADVDGNVAQGAVYVFTRSGETWTEQTRLVAADGKVGDHFGRSVSLSGDVALVGVDFLPQGGQPVQGAAYVFTRNGNTWSEQAKLAASDGGPGDQFGYAVAVSGLTAIVGARGATIDGNILQGAAYVFTYSGTGWSEQAKLTASDGAVGDSLGQTVAFDGNTVIAGAPLATLDATFGRGAAYVFTGSGSQWSEQAKLTASDYENNVQFGVAVALDRDTALVGVPLGDVNGNEDQGAAYVFARTGSAWSEQAKLTHSGGAPGDYFGDGVAVEGDTVLVGAPRVEVNGNMDQGVAYVFEPLQAGFSLYLPALTAE